MRLIDADALAKTLEKLWNVHDDQDFCNKDVWRELENAPTAEPERKKGEWIEKEDPYGFFDSIPVCSECGCTNTMRERYNFCPMCGSYNGEEEK